MIARLFPGLAEAVGSYLRGARCPICLQRSRFLTAHIHVDHAGDDE